MISYLLGAMLAISQALPAAPPTPSDSAPSASERARARANLASYVSNDDYPIEALRNEEQGAVGFRLDVGADGSVTACTVTSSSGSAALDSRTCEIMMARARFTPARDARGRPTPDQVSARINWRIQEGGSGLTPFIPLRVTAMFRVTPAGETTCTIVVNDQPAQSTPCPPSAGATRAAQAAGRPVEQTIVTAMIPDGETAAPVAADHGDLRLDAEAVLSIATDGSILECRLVRNQALGLPPGAPDPPNPCVRYAAGQRPVFQPTTSPGPRLMRLTIRAYTRS